MPLARLDWRTDGDGHRHARIDIASLGAKAMRVALRLDSSPAGLAFDFAGVGQRNVGSTTSGKSIAAEELFWSPVVTGDVLSVGVRAAGGTDIGDLHLIVPRVSHLVVDGADLNPFRELAHA